MTEISRIVATRNAIDRVLNVISARLSSDNSCIEIDLTPDATVFVEINIIDNGTYYELELASVDVFKDTLQRACELPNIAAYFARKLEKMISRYNKDEDEYYN